MNINTTIQTNTLSISRLMALITCVLLGQQITIVAEDTDNRTLKSEITNISEHIFVRERENNKGILVCSVYLNHRGKNGFSSESYSQKSEVEIGLDGLFKDKSLYFLPTNLLAGTMELVDSQGNQVQMFSRAASLSNEYPVSFNLSVERKHHSQHPMKFPAEPHVSMCVFNDFSIKDYFNITTSGTYRLTIWPKLYHRASTNDDLCVRMDLPPVSTTFDWNVTKNKQVNQLEQFKMK
jgi:hypothetical protein